MNPAFSIYLDLVRFFAAFCVFFHHLNARLVGKDILWWRLGSYGELAVTIFFVLSGYVISHVVATREKSLATYTISRIARLYSVIIPALILTFALDYFGQIIKPEIYSNVLAKPASWTGYISSLFFINEFQIFRFNGIQPGSNGPFWSLSFEVTYYIVAGIIIFQRRLALIVGVILLLCAGKTIIVLMPLWFMGFYLRIYQNRIIVCRYTSIATFIVSIIGLVLMPNARPYLSPDNYGLAFPWGGKPFNREIQYDYITALLFLIHLIAAINIFNQTQILLRNKRIINWLGSLTFPLYCFHYPLIFFSSAISFWPSDNPLHLLFIVFITFGVVILSTPLCDHYKILIKSKLSQMYQIRYHKK